MEGKENYSNFIWIGLKKDEKEVWHWVDGTEMNFKKWSTGEPNNLENKEGCGQMYTYGVPRHPEGNTYWNDVWCNRTMRYFVCKTVLIIEKL
ncbi:lectin C-type domain protein [Ancylostoma ceylanicum]|uniref:Lectin C-type domain protein n=1 Tax=Ancylostoma ceylanicum TaxID=53326 RepID=A0A0D6M9B0_9BILA|nr:lectin C-type domain protein [Ancylostoma ceylanicum]